MILKWLINGKRKKGEDSGLGDRKAGERIINKLAEGEKTAQLTEKGVKETFHIESGGR